MTRTQVLLGVLLIGLSVLCRQSAASSEVLVNGGMVSGAISSPGEQDAYVFAANAGEGVLLQAAYTSGSGTSPVLSLYGPSGALIRAVAGAPVAQISHQLTLSGTYTVVVADWSHHTGTYNLHFVRAPRANEGGTLINGGVRSDAIDLGDLDSYTFTANAGENVLLQAAYTSGSGTSPVLSLYGPSGALIRAATGAPVAQISHQVTVSGTYTVVMADWNRGTGTYSLYFVRAPGANEGGTLIGGGVRSDAIDLGDLDSYTFTANAGENVLLRAAYTDGGHLILRLYGPSGAFIASRNYGAALSHPVTVSGTYTVVVGDWNHGTGPYSLTFERESVVLSYAALGDSYSSGEGVFPYFDTTDLSSGCHRSTRAYPTLIQVPGTTTPIANRADAQFDFFACSGAVTDNVTASGEGQEDEPPQLAPSNGVNDTRDLVTMSIGGNNAKFVPIIKFCFAHPSCNTIKPFAPYLDIELGDLFPLWVAVVKTRVLAVYEELRNATPNAATLILGYPILLSGRECAAVKVPFFEDLKLSESEQVFLRDATRQVNTAAEEAATHVGMHYIPVADHFIGHEICGTLDNWINGLVLYNLPASFHPTSQGQREYARVANAYLESKASGWPYGYFPTGLPRNPDPALISVPQSAAAVAASTMTLPEFGELEVSFANAPAGCEAVRDVIVPGGSATLSGKGFAPSESVAVSLAIAGVPTFALGTVTADGSGHLNATVPIPDTAPVGAVGTIEALAAGPNGVGRLLLTLVRIEASIAVDGDGDGIPDGCDNCPPTPILTNSTRMVTGVGMCATQSSRSRLRTAGRPGLSAARRTSRGPRVG